MNKEIGLKSQDSQLKPIQPETNPIDVRIELEQWKVDEPMKIQGKKIDSHRNIPSRKPRNENNQVKLGKKKRSKNSLLSSAGRSKSKATSENPVISKVKPSKIKTAVRSVPAQSKF